MLASEVGAAAGGSGGVERGWVCDVPVPPHRCREGFVSHGRTTSLEFGASVRRRDQTKPSASPWGIPKKSNFWLSTVFTKILR